MIKSLCDQILCYYRIPLPPTWSSTLLAYCLQQPMPMKISTVHRDLHAHQTVIVILICFGITITSAFQNQYNDCLRHQLWGWSFVSVQQRLLPPTRRWTHHLSIIPCRQRPRLHHRHGRGGTRRAPNLDHQVDSFLLSGRTFYHSYDEKHYVKFQIR